MKPGDLVIRDCAHSKTAYRVVEVDGESIALKELYWRHCTAVWRPMHMMGCWVNAKYLRPPLPNELEELEVIERMKFLGSLA